MFGTKFKALTLLTVFVLLVASLVGCRSSEDEKKEATAEPAQVEKTKVSRDGSFVVVIAEDPPSFNGAATDTGYEQLVMEMTMLGLTDLDPVGSVFPELAAELPTLENGGVAFDEDAWTMDVTWKMRDDVYWADGEPVTADDVIFTWDAIMDPDGGIWVDGSDYTDSVEKVDDYTFVVHYNSVYPDYLLQFGGENVVIWPEHYCDAEQGFVAWDCGREPLSDGPFLLQEWMAGDHLTFVRNPTYFEAGKPHLDKIIVRVVPDPSVRKIMMVEGDADVNVWLSPTIVDELKDAPGIKLSSSPATRWVMRLIPNLAARGSIDSEADPHPILSDVRVRQAIRRAIDVDLIANQIFLGHSKAVWTEFFRIPYICDVPRITYDDEIAAVLLEQAGWTDRDGDGVRECHGCTTGAEDGYKMSMEFMIYGEYGEELELAQQLIAEMLGDVGIELQLSVVEGGILWADYESGGIEQQGNFDLNMWDDGYPGIDPTDHLWTFYYSEAGLPDYGWNVGRWSDENFDALLDEAYTLDEGYRHELFCQMAEILNEQAPQILLWSGGDVHAHSSRVEGVQATVNDIVTWNVADWEIVE